MQPDGSYSKPKTRQYANYGIGKFPGSPAVIEPSVKPKKRIRQDSKPLMNGLEADYYRILCERFLTADIKPQALRFKLANGLWYKPDFTIMHHESTSRMLAVEVKGSFAFRGGFENLKSAAFQWPQVQFILVWKESGIWQEQEILK